MKRQYLVILFLILGTLLMADLPFSYQSTLIEETPRYRLYHVTYDSPDAPFWEEARQVKAFYYEPTALPSNGAPAVLCLHILGGNGQLTKSIAAFFADHGLPTLMPQMPLFLERRPQGRLTDILYGKDGIRYILAALRAIPSDIKRSVDFLASRDHVDAKRLNLIGTSFGGILGVSAVANDSRLSKAVFLLAGGNLSAILNGENREVAPIRAAIQKATAEQKAELSVLCEALEPLNYTSKLASKAAAGQIRLYNAELDQIVPAKCSQALAKGLGLTENNGHYILPNTDHYTGVAALPQLLEDSLAFFDGRQPAIAPAEANAARLRTLAANLKAWFAPPASDSTVDRLGLRISIREHGQERQAGVLQFLRAKGKFKISLAKGKGLGGFQQFSLGKDDFPWAISPNGTVFQGDCVLNQPPSQLLPEPFHRYFQMANTFLGYIATTGSLETLSKLLHMNWSFQDTAKQIFIAKGNGWNLEMTLTDRDAVPRTIRYLADDKQVEIEISQWETGTKAQPCDFSPSGTTATRTVDSDQLFQAIRRLGQVAWERLSNTRAAEKALCSVERDVWFEKGLRLERPGQFPVLFFAGTPEEMGRQHGTLCREEIHRTYECLRLVAGGYLFLKNEWFYDTISHIQKRTASMTPQRYLTELDNLSKKAGLTAAQGREIGFFPELFHCSGIAARGKATIDGKVVHARVLDYMRDIGLQDIAQIQVYLPEGFHPWITVGFAGFNGTVTAMNDVGLAMGEMGGRGEGNWDGLPMSFLMRRIMEECSTVTEAKRLIEKTPLTCEYYYVLSDSSGDMLAVETRAGEQPIFLEAGQPYPKLKEAFEDIVWITAPSRQPALCERLHQYFGRLDAMTMQQVIRRPVAMASNLHNAIFLPETLDLYFAYADATRPACDCPYHHLNLKELIQYYKEHLPTVQEPPANH